MATEPNATPQHPGIAESRLVAIQVAIRTHRHRTMAVLIGTFLVLLGLHLYQLHVFLDDGPHYRSIDFNKEHNWPTAFATLNLGFAAYLLIYIGQARFTVARRAQWYTLGGIFVFLACDEYGVIHDGLTGRLHALAQYSDFLHHAWVVPYAVLLFVFAVGFTKFFFSLPLRFRLLFGISGAVFVTGALGIEMLGAPLAKNFGGDDPRYLKYSTLEETLEFAGILLFTYSLLAYIEDRRIAFAAEQDATAA